MTRADPIVADGSPDEADAAGASRRGKRVQVRKFRNLEESCGDSEPLPSSDDAAEDRPPGAFLRVFSLWIVPVATMLLTLAVGYLKYEASVADSAARAGAEAEQAAKNGTVAILSYTPETAEATLGAARDRLTGTFRDSYSSLTHDVVIPAAKQRSISATATVADAAVVSASVNHALILVFVNQAITMGTDAPSSSNSVVEVSLDRSGDRWLISGFDPK